MLPNMLGQYQNLITFSLIFFDIYSFLHLNQTLYFDTCQVLLHLLKKVSLIIYIKLHIKLESLAQQPGYKTSNSCNCLSNVPTNSILLDDETCK